MPTTKPRVIVSFDEHTHDVISRYAELQGKTRGVIISEFIDSVVPSISKVVDLFDLAAESKSEAENELISRVESFSNHVHKMSVSKINSSKFKKSLKTSKNRHFRKKQKP